MAEPRYNRQKAEYLEKLAQGLFEAQVTSWSFSGWSKLAPHIKDYWLRQAVQLSPFVVDFYEQEEANDKIDAAITAAVEQERIKLLSGFYIAYPVHVAKLCDETLDKSGALLGKVRKAVVAFRDHGG